MQTVTPYLMIDLLCNCSLGYFSQENEESKVYADEAFKKNEHLKRENDRLRNLSADLSQQVCSAKYIHPLPISCSKFTPLCFVVH